MSSSLEHHTIFESFDKSIPSLFVIFGATGDLTHRKLLPALYNLMSKKLLPKKFAIVAIGRRDKKNDEYRIDAQESLKKYTKSFKEDIWNELKELISYFKLDLDTEDDYENLNKYFNELDKKYHTKGNRIFYLATSPVHFSPIVNNLKKYNFVKRDNGNTYKIVVEKPFGSNLESAKELNETLCRVFREEELYRIDHYLGKEAVQNLFALRFANRIFNSVWCSEQIKNVQITVSESIGVGTRGGYYDKSGAVRDMVQNHILQILSLVAMETPKSFESDDIKKEKVKVLKTLKPFSKEEVKENVIFGQYKDGKEKAYRKENGVDKNSRTDTYVAMKLKVNNNRWKNTPFYIRTGKGLKKKTTEVVIYFKEPTQKVFHKMPQMKPNILVIRLQPNEGIYLRLNSKKPGNDFEMQRVSMDFCQDCLFDINTPEAYEKLMHDLLLGDSTLFTRWDEVELAWQIVDPITKYWENSNKEPLFYEFGSDGPKEISRLIEDKEDHWRDLKYS